MSCFCFFFNDTATTEIYTLPLPDALPISGLDDRLAAGQPISGIASVASFFVSRVDTEVDRRIDAKLAAGGLRADRKSTRLNSSHANISYAVFCLKKKKHDRIHYYYRLITC